MTSTKGKLKNLMEILSAVKQEKEQSQTNENLKSKMYLKLPESIKNHKNNRPTSQHSRTSKRSNNAPGTASPERRSGFGM